MDKKILLIDDEADFCFFVKTNLELISDYKINIASDGQEGIKAVLRLTPDLILLDLVMPGISGFEVLKRLKENEKTRFIPVIVLTAIDKDDSRSQVAGYDVESYIVKPFAVEDLKEKIENVLNQSKEEL